MKGTLPCAMTITMTISKEREGRRVDPSDIRELRHDPDARRYEAVLGDGSLAVVDYRREGDRILITHTGTPVRHRNRGIAGELTRYALDDAVERGLKIAPHCPFTADFVRRNPRYQEHLAPGFE